jgi:N-sulfoglucosamine sulfohydrolase
LYDLQNDPDEVNNLAAAPDQQERVATMRSAMIQWMDAIDDKGFIPELVGSPTTMPDRERPKVLPPIAVLKDGKVELTCATAGASITYKDDRIWRLYSAPLELKSQQNLRAKACRAGFEDSDEIDVAK